MRYAILSDIHSNLEALEAVIAACQEEGVRAYFCTGDIVGYGANPNECVERIKGLRTVCVTGNHDRAVAGKLDFSYFHPAAQAAVEWTQKHLLPEHRDFLTELPLTFKNQELMMAHGTLNKPDKFTYLTDMSQAADTFYLMDTKLCFLGHTHVPKVIIQKPDQMGYGDPRYVELDNPYRYIINPGSVGQPRDGNPDASFCIYDPDLERLEIKRVPYPVQIAQQKILEAGLPDLLARRLALGQ